MINLLEREAGLERQAEMAAAAGLENAEDREAIVLAFELEAAADPERPGDTIEALKQFALEIRDFLDKLRA
ncbi:MAG: hypothetical protein ACM3NH_03805 [Candidatus Saccharibacteria bacterium]